MLLYQVGTETKGIFEMLANTGEDYDTAKTKLDKYFSPKKNVTQMSPMRFFNSDKQHNKQVRVSNSLPPDYAN